MHRGYLWFEEPKIRGLEKKSMIRIIDMKVVLKNMNEMRLKRNEETENERFVQRNELIC